MNTTAITGNVTRDPELRYLEGGAATCTFGIAVERRWQDKNGVWQEATSFFDVVTWREQAENVAETLKRGSRVIVAGRMEQRTWTDNETGKVRSKVEIVADEVGPSLRFAATTPAPSAEPAYSGEPF